MDLSNVYLPAVSEDSNMVSGRFPPQRIKSEDTDSCNLLVRSEDRFNGNSFDFQVDLLTSTSHIRKIALSKIITPLCPQINNFNKSITVVHQDGDITFDLVEGFYSVQSLSNMMQDTFLTAWQTLDATNSVTVNYDIERRSISIIDDNGEDFYIVTGCPFDRFARNVVRFETQPQGSPLSTSSLESSSLGMIYSRFLLLTSSRLTEDQKSFSVVSAIGPSNIVAIIDIASKYSESQFAVSTSFPGTEFVIDTLGYAPRINLLNRNKALKVIDFQLLDEFGNNLNDISDGSFPFNYSLSLFFQCYL